MPETITLRTAGVDFHAERRGSQPRAVFVHGFGGDLHTWDTVWQAIGDKLEALRYDLRGFGRSVCRQRVPFKHADDLLAILDASEIERCDLVGVSMGGGIALNFTLDHPERVRSLVVISPGLVGWEWSDAWRALWQPIVDHARGGELDVVRRLWWSIRYSAPRARVLRDRRCSNPSCGSPASNGFTMITSPCCLTWSGCIC